MNNDALTWAALSPATFSHYCSNMQNVEYYIASHIKKINNALLRIENGTLKRLIISLPPRHGKSELCSKFFPSWFLIRNPNKRIILAGYEKDFAASWGRKAREIITEHGQNIGGVSVSDISSAADRWETNYGGGMVCAGAGGAITGRGADVFIIDDPVKNSEEAHSKIYREKIWDWYRSVALTRLEPSGAMIIIMTRWHEDDLVGKIIEQEGDQWEQIVFPAIDEKGNSLFPKRYPLSALLEIKNSVGSYIWNSLYQQQPSPQSGEIIKSEWLKICVPIAVSRPVRFWDLAVSIKTSADDHAGALCGYVGNNFVIADMIYGKMEYPDLRRRIIQQAISDGTNTMLCIEDAGQQRGFIDDISRDPALSMHTIRAVRPSGDKFNRALPWVARAELGTVYLCRGAWNRPFSDQCAAFTANDSHAHDDMIDAVSGAYQSINTNENATSTRISL